MDTATDATQSLIQVEAVDLIRALTFVLKMPLPDGRRPTHLLWRVVDRESTMTLCITGYDPVYPTTPAYEVQIDPRDHYLNLASDRLPRVAFYAEASTWQTLLIDLQRSPSPTWGVRLTADLRDPQPDHAIGWVITTPTITLRPTVYVGDHADYCRVFTTHYDTAPGECITLPSIDTLPLSRMAPIGDGNYRIELQGVHLASNGQGHHRYNAVDGFRIHTVERQWNHWFTQPYEVMLKIDAVKALRIAEEVYDVDVPWCLSTAALQGQQWMTYGPVAYYNPFLLNQFPRNVATTKVLNARPITQERHPFHRHGGEAVTVVFDIRALLKRLDELNPTLKRSNWVLAMRARRDGFDLGTIEPMTDQQIVRGEVDTERQRSWYETPTLAYNLLNDAMERKPYHCNSRYLLEGLSLLRRSGHKTVTLTLRTPRDIQTWEASRVMSGYEEIELHSIMPITDGPRAVRDGNGAVTGKGKQRGRGK